MPSLEQAFRPAFAGEPVPATIVIQQVRDTSFDAAKRWGSGGKFGLKGDRQDISGGTTPAPIDAQPVITRDKWEANSNYGTTFSRSGMVNGHETQRGAAQKTYKCEKNPNIWVKVEQINSLSFEIEAMPYLRIIGSSGATGGERSAYMSFSLKWPTEEQIGLV
jgi:hypothetical protein